MFFALFDLDAKGARKRKICYISKRLIFLRQLALFELKICYISKRLIFLRQLAVFELIATNTIVVFQKHGLNQGRHWLILSIHYRFVKKIWALSVFPVLKRISLALPLLEIGQGQFHRPDIKEFSDHLDTWRDEKK